MCWSICQGTCADVQWCRNCGRTQHEQTLLPQCQGWSRSSWRGTLFATRRWWSPASILQDNHCSVLTWCTTVARGDRVPVLHPSGLDQLGMPGVSIRGQCGPLGRAEVESKAFGEIQPQGCQLKLQAHSNEPNWLWAAEGQGRTPCGGEARQETALSLSDHGEVWGHPWSLVFTSVWEDGVLYEVLQQGEGGHWSGWAVPIYEWQNERACEQEKDVMYSTWSFECCITHSKSIYLCLWRSNKYDSKSSIKNLFLTFNMTWNENEIIE